MSQTEVQPGSLNQSLSQSWSANGERMYYIGPLRVLRHLGSGAMGEVFLCQDPQRAGDQCAVKVLGEAFAFDEEALARFQREIDSQARVRDHPGIVKIYHSGRTPEGRPYLAMEVIEGQSMEDLLKQGLLSPPQIMELVVQVAAALAFAHERGLVHRDVKPENVMVDNQGRAKVADFGLAKAVSGQRSERLTRTGEILGTPAFMAPEQANSLDFGEAGPYTDVYGLGAMLYFALVGDYPHPGQTAIEIYTKISSGDRAPALCKMRPDRWGRILNRVVGKALEPLPANRYADAGEFALAFREALEGSGGGGAGTPLAIKILASVALVSVLLAGGAVAVAVGRRGAGPGSGEAVAAADPAEISAAWAKGETARAKELLSQAKAPPPEAAAIHACVGDMADALEAAKLAGDHAAAARIAAWLGDTPAWIEARDALPSGRAHALAYELGLEPPAGEVPRNDVWGTLARAERDLAQGDGALAALGFSQLHGSDSPPVALRARVGLLRAALTQGDLQRAARWWTQARAGDELSAFDQGRLQAWAAYLSLAGSVGPFAGLPSGLKYDEPTLPDELRSAARESSQRAPNLPLAQAAKAIQDGETPDLERAKVLGLVQACRSRGEHLVYLAERGVDLRSRREGGAFTDARQLLIVAARLGADLGRVGTSLARAQRYTASTSRAEECLASVEPGPARALLQAELEAQTLDEEGKRADQDRARKQDDVQRQVTYERMHTLGESWSAAVASARAALAAAGDAQPQRARAQLRLAAGLAERARRLRAGKSKRKGKGGIPQAEVVELRDLVAKLAGGEDQGARHVQARDALGDALLNGERDPIRNAELQAREACTAWLAQRPSIPPAIQKQALRIGGISGSPNHARALHLLEAALAARARMAVERAAVAAGPRRVQELRHGIALDPEAPGANYALELTRLSVHEFASDMAGLRRLAQVLIARPEWAAEIVALLSLAKPSQNLDESVLEDTPVDRLAWALAAGRGPELSPPALREVARRAKGLGPAGLFLRGLALAQGDTTQASVKQELVYLSAALRAAVPYWPLSDRLSLLCAPGLDRESLSRMLAAGLLTKVPRREGRSRYRYRHRDRDRDQDQDQDDETANKVFGQPMLGLKELVKRFAGAGLVALTHSRSQSLAKRLLGITKPEAKSYPFAFAACLVGNGDVRDGVRPYLNALGPERHFALAAWERRRDKSRSSATYAAIALWGWPLGGTISPLFSRQVGTGTVPNVAAFGTLDAHRIAVRFRAENPETWRYFQQRGRNSLRVNQWLAGTDEADPYEVKELRRSIGGGAQLFSLHSRDFYNKVIGALAKSGQVRETRLALDCLAAFHPARDYNGGRAFADSLFDDVVENAIVAKPPLREKLFALVESAVAIGYRLLPDDPRRSQDKSARVTLLTAECLLLLERAGLAEGEERENLVARIKSLNAELDRRWSKDRGATFRDFSAMLGSWRYARALLACRGPSAAAEGIGWLHGSLGDSETEQRRLKAAIESDPWREEFMKIPGVEGIMRRLSMTKQRGKGKKKADRKKDRKKKRDKKKKDRKKDKKKKDKAE